jgi:hypothetical protein
MFRQIVFLMVVSEKKINALKQTRDDVTICILYAQLLQRSNTWNIENAV